VAFRVGFGVALEATMACRVRRDGLGGFVGLRSFFA
jgi:hypothetical protein